MFGTDIIMNDERYSQIKLEEDFFRLESCVEITHNFFAIPEDAQRSIIRLNNHRFSHSGIITYTNIFHRLNQMFPKIDAMQLLHNYAAYEGCKGYSPELSEEYVEQTYRFVSFQQSTTNNVIWALGRASGTLIDLLVPIYGEDRLIRAMQLWMDHVESNSKIEDFVTLVDQLDNIDESYPLSWTLGLIRADICTNLEMVQK